MTSPVDYDQVATEYDRRYGRHGYEGIGETVRAFVEDQITAPVVEVGCGTGHWLADLSSRGFTRLNGLDYSQEMLRRARAAAPGARLVRGTASRLPWCDRSFDRLFCVNALHHFPDQRAFIAESRRVLRPGAGWLSIGMDPHQGDHQWWVYDFFPAALHADRLRYTSTETIRRWLAESGFRGAETRVAHRISLELPFDTAWQQGFVDRKSTSQMMVIGDDEYDAGLKRLVAERPVLRASVRLFATTAWI